MIELRRMHSLSASMACSGHSDFHISDGGLASKVGIPSRRPECADLLHPTKRACTVKLGPPSDKNPGGKAGSCLVGSFLTKPKQLIKFDLIVPISIESPGADAMKNVYEVLWQKELELSRLEKEVEALRVAAPLLSEDKEAGNDNKPTWAATAAQQPIRIPQPAVNTAPQAARAAGWEDTAKRWP